MIGSIRSSFYSSGIITIPPYSKNVNLAVGKVVGASQTGKESQNVSEEIDFSKMTYTQAKKLEMDTQVSF